MTRVRPLRSALKALLRVAPGLAPEAEKLIWRAVYELASAGRRDVGAMMMNYGYASLDSEADAVPVQRPDDHYGLQLYRAVAGAVDLTGLDVLEVGCGRGGGAAFVFDTFSPRSLLGVDLARSAIRRCQREHGRPGLQFRTGDAEALPFGDRSFDVVLSVESSHCYSHPDRFLREVHRVLAPGGRLLLADFRDTAPVVAKGALFAADDVALLRDQVAAAGFVTIEEEDITANVIRALQLDTPVRRPRIERRVPRPLREHALAFAAVEGSPVFEAFADGRRTYLRFVLEKH